MSKPILFQEGASKGDYTLFIIKSTHPNNIVPEQYVKITIISTSPPPPKYKIEKIHNDVISVFDYPDGEYEIKNKKFLKHDFFTVFIRKVNGNEPSLYTIEIYPEADAAKRGGNSFRHVSRKRKNNRRLGSKKRLSVNQRRSRRVRRVRRSRKN